MSRYSLDGTIRWSRPERIQHLLDRATAHLTVATDLYHRGHRESARANWGHGDRILHRVNRILGHAAPRPEGIPQPVDGRGCGEGVV